MKRREFILSRVVAWPLATVLAPAFWTTLAWSQPPDNPRRVGWIAIGSEEVFRKHRAKVILATFAELGYHEGKNLILDMRYGGGSFERGPEFARELLESGAEVLVTGGFALSVGALQVTKTMPVVGVGCGLDQLVASIARPGGNFTGISCPDSELGGKQLQLLSEVIPGERQLAALVDPKSPIATHVTEDLKRAAAAGNIAVQLIVVRGPEEIEGTFGEIARLGLRGVAVTSSGMFFGERGRLVTTALAHRVPIVTTWRETTDLGGLLSYGHSFIETSRRAVGTVDKILKGAKPADLPMEQPIKFELIVNLKTARELDLTIPPKILMLADEVIE